MSIGLDLIVKRHLAPGALNWTEDKIFDAISEITHVRLDNCRLNSMDGLQLLSHSVTNLYLHYNNISTIESLEHLPSLRILVLSHNEIEKIYHLVPRLTNLQLLDLSYNKIKDFDIDELPRSLLILSLMNNPCTHMRDYRTKIVQDLPRLQSLDGEPVTSEEKEEVGYAPYEFSGTFDRLIPTQNSEEEEAVCSSVADILKRSQLRSEELLYRNKAVIANRPAKEENTTKLCHVKSDNREDPEVRPVVSDILLNPKQKPISSDRHHSNDIVASVKLNPLKTTAKERVFHRMSTELILGTPRTRVSAPERPATSIDFRTNQSRINKNNVDLSWIKKSGGGDKLSITAKKFGSKTKPLPPI